MLLLVRTMISDDKIVMHLKICKKNDISQTLSHCVRSRSIVFFDAANINDDMPTPGQGFHLISKIKFPDYPLLCSALFPDPSQVQVLVLCNF